MPTTSKHKAFTTLGSRLLAGNGQNQLRAVHYLLPGSQPTRTKSQLTTGCALCLATPLLFELSAWACVWTAACLVQPAERSSSSLLFFSSLVSSWRQNRTDLSFSIKWPLPEGCGGLSKSLCGLLGTSLVCSQPLKL